MKPKQWWLGLSIVGFVMVAVWMFAMNNYQLYKYFASKVEEVRNETFKESTAYNEGMVQELQQLQLDYVRSTSKEEKDAVASVILHRFAGYDETKLSDDLRAFLHNLKVERGVAR